MGGDVYTGLRLKWVEVGEVLGLGLDRIRISLVRIPLLICNGNIVILPVYLPKSNQIKYYYFYCSCYTRLNIIIILYS